MDKIVWQNAPIYTPKRHGFVYEIKELDTGKIYIGCKKFWTKFKRPPLKGKKNKRHDIKESDWRDYNSSSPIMQEKIKANPSNYTKQILHICDSQTEMKCKEAWIQLDYFISGNWDRLYNEVINLRVKTPKNDKDRISRMAEGSPSAMERQ